MGDSKDLAAMNQDSDSEPELIGAKEMLHRLQLPALPEDTKLFNAKRFGTSAWTITGRMEVIEPDGTHRPYFVKVAYGKHGRTMLNGEWESSKIIHAIMPDFIPKPQGFGKFIDMDVTTAPDPARWAARLAALHKSSVSPTGKFGFHVTTCDGKLSHTVDWDASWASFYRKLLLGVCKLDLEANGPWPELERATAQICEVVIPRLLENLRTSEGEPTKPCLIHGNLWERNMGINTKTGDTLLFDAGSFFAHNEMELSHWRCEFSSVFRDEVYTQKYLLQFPTAEPANEFDDCNRLYSLKDGIDKYDPTIDPSISGARIVPHLAEGLI
ncbi:Fructosamine kinase-domain-containing protein [Podospora fimiseda]|uniref:protein-ribulosamine 3-kinase n=1 Tax=Podospora fimiseda TaxID=252190 RepID=A0AAN7BH69_9PEZI|nr:Fructosamine kinase-domain-containing protein [Podospora fimiseda]